MNLDDHVLIIGGGPGGYVAAIRAAQLGGNVTLVDDKHLGGTCLNEGCIPTKAFLHAASLVNAVGEAKEWGAALTLQEFNWKQVLAKKDEVVKKLVQGVSYLLKQNGVEVIQGFARLVGPHTVQVDKKNGESISLQAGKIILACGSEPSLPGIPGLSESRHVMTSSQALSMEKLPDSMIILGGGVIGAELAYAFQSFGCQITILESMPDILSTQDREIRSGISQALTRLGVKLHVGLTVTRVRDEGEGIRVIAEKDGSTEEFTAQRLLVAVGRRPRTKDMGLDEAGIRTERGKILVNEYLETTCPGIYAIGDCTGQTMLAHFASAQGEHAAENAMGEKKPFSSACCPSCIYTTPEAASVGLTEEQAVQQGLAFQVGRFPLSANGRALIEGTGGMVKVLAGTQFGEILGVHILGPNATELIGEATLAIEMEATTDELIHAIHAHPTVSEAIREAAMASQGRAIHTLNKKR